MKEERYHVALDDYEHGIIIRSLNDTKTELKNRGKAGVYQHGAVRSDIATIEVTYLDPKTLPDTEVPETDYVLLSDEDFDENQSSK